MKSKTFLLLCLVLGFSTSRISSQTLKKDVVISVNTYKIVLNPDVTMNEFLDFYINKYIPAFEKNHPGVKELVTIGNRGEFKNQIGSLTYYESLAVRDKYFPDESGQLSDAAKAAEEKMKDLNQELDRYLVEITRTFTDWIIR
jgi:hypothetical protein